MNINREKLVIPVCVFAVFVLWITGSTGVSVPNLTESCYRCLCHVTTQCDLNNGCKSGYCGPFNLTKVYWTDGGKYIPDDDDDVTAHGYSWETCAKNYQCAKKIVESYLEKFAKDCNADGVIDCYDHMMVNANGGYGCTAPLNRSANGRKWLKRYSECKL